MINNKKCTFNLVKHNVYKIILREVAKSLKSMCVWIGSKCRKIKDFIQKNCTNKQSEQVSDAPLMFKTLLLLNNFYKGKQI